MTEKIIKQLGLQDRAPPSSPARDQTLQAEPGLEPSTELFVPDEDSGHWSGAPCKRSDVAQPRPFRAIIGGGRVALILDIGSLARRARH